MKVFSLKKYMKWNDGKAKSWAEDCDGQPVEGNTVKGKSGKQYLCYTDEWYEEVPDCKVIFNDKATVLIKDGKKYVSKCMDGDTYDKEKGLLLCLAKANGISYNDLQEMIAGAKDCNGEKVDDKAQVREVKRKAEVGEYIKIVAPKNSFGDYTNGDIFKVKQKSDDGVTVEYYGKDKNGDEKCTFMFHSEYVVLENYTSYKITLSEFWAREERLAIYCESELQVKCLCKTMLKRGFKNKKKNEVFIEYARYVLNDKHCICTAINQANGKLDCKTVYNFDEVDLEH